MKILHITKKYPNALGGDAIIVSNLEKEQKLRGHDVVILTSNSPEILDGPHIHKFGFSDSSAGLDAITPKRLLSLVGLFCKAFTVIRRERPDVIHTHSIDMAMFISFAARFYKVPIVHSFHILTFYDKTQSPLRRKIELPFAKLARPKAITAPNSYDIKKLADAGVKATLLPYGVDLKFWQKSAKAKKTSKRFNFISIGRLEDQKGYIYLVKAASLLKKRDFRITVAGDGSLMKSLNELAKELHVDEKIEFIGRRNRDELKKLYEQMDAAVIPSLYETGPLTLLEAWAMHVPTIITPVGLLADTTDNHQSVLQIKPADEQSLAKAMELMMTTTDRIRMAAYAYKKVQGYSWKSMGLTLEGLYASVQESKELD